MMLHSNTNGCELSSVWHRAATAEGSMAPWTQLQVVCCGLSCFWVSACVVTRICWCIKDADDEM